MGDSLAAALAEYSPSVSAAWLLGFMTVWHVPCSGGAACLEKSAVLIVFKLVTLRAYC